MAEPGKTNIFFLGATGYIGGVLLEKILDHPNASRFNLSALVRSEAKGNLLEQVGVKPVIGSLSDGEVVCKLCSEADYLFSTADCDHVEGTQYMLAGMKARFESTGRKPILIHTSGAGTVIDDAQGDHASDKIYSDMDLQQLDSLPDDQPHRSVDLLILNADTTGYIDAYIVLPSGVFGIADGKLAKLGVHQSHSLGFRPLNEYFVQRGQAGTVGQGKNIFSFVHVDDLVDFYLLIFESLQKDRSSCPHGREAYYFVENGEMQYHLIYSAYAKAMAARGIGTDQPTTFGPEETPPAIFTHFLGKNCRVRADRARKMGWKPQKTPADLLASIPSEIDGSLAMLPQ